MAIDVDGANAYFETQLTDKRWKKVKQQEKAIVMAITDIATALGFSDDSDLDEDNANTHNACYEQALWLAEKLDDIEDAQIASIANLESQRVDGLGEEVYKTNGKVKSMNGIILAPRAKAFLRRLRGPFRVVR